MHTLLDLAWQAGAVAFVATLLMTVHELGHYLAARSLGILVDRFVVGFGPRLLDHTDWRGCTWELRLLPLLGFISFVEARDGSSDATYAERPPWQRSLVIAGGPGGNLLLAAAAFALLLAVQGQAALLAVANEVIPGGAAERAGMQPGDRLLAINGQPIAHFEELRPTLRANPGRPVSLLVERAGTRMELAPTLDSREEHGRTIGTLGIRSTTTTYLAQTPGEIAEAAVGRTWSTMEDTVRGIAGLLATGDGAENLAGPIGVAAITGEAAAQSLAMLLALTAILSANIALMNLLPIPVLDGGQLVLCGLEALRRQPVSARLQQAGNAIGVTLIVALLLLTTTLDLARLDPFGWAGMR